MLDLKIENLVIIGSGPAGLTAAIYAARAKLNPLVVEGSNPGGQLVGTSFVENWPGEKSILGAELMLKIKDQAAHFGARFLPKSVSKVDFLAHPFKLWTNSDQLLLAKSIIIATGAVPKRLNCPGEAEYWGKGVTSCAVCDGALYPNEPVVIVGGGDSAMEDAIFMTKFTDQITIVQNLEQLTASRIMQDRVLNNPKIKIYYNSLVTQIDGDSAHVTTITVTNQKTKNILTIPTKAIFVAVGLEPLTSLFSQLATTKLGHLQVKNHTNTSIPGIFAAGDVCDARYRQAISSAGAGCMAALDAEKYLAINN